MDIREEKFPRSSKKEVAILSLSVSPITPLAFILCAIPARIADFAELRAWYQGDKDPSTVFINCSDRNLWRGPTCGHQFKVSPLRLSLIFGPLVCPVCNPSQCDIAFNLGCCALGIPPKTALFLAAPREEAIGRATRWINEHRSTSQPLVSKKSIHKAYNKKTGMTVSVVLQDGRLVLMLVHRFIDAIFDKIGDMNAAAESSAAVQKKAPKQERKWSNKPPCILVPGVKKPKHLQGQEVKGSFEKYMNQILHKTTSMAIIINARGILPGNYGLDAWIPDLGIAFEWDAGGESTHPLERQEYKDRLAKQMGITVYHVNPTKRYPRQFMITNVRRAVKAAEKRLLQRLIDNLD